MIYTELTKKAMRIAFEVHKDQSDKGGIPYIAHPLHLAEQMEDENSTIAALLHDVIEDSDGKYSIKKLKEDGFPEEAVEAVKALTHKKNVPYMKYIENIKPNEIARKVKIADLEHNLTISRLGNIDERTSKKLEKYHEAKAFLEEKEAMF